MSTLNLSQLERVVSIIKQGSRFLITGHEHADGDALGSQIALYYFLKQLGKNVSAINCDPPQKKLAFLDTEHVVKTYSPPPEIGAFDAWIIVDTSALLRIGVMGELVKKLKCPIIAIDHHVFSREEAFAAINIVDDREVATGVMIYNLGKALGCHLDRRIALALYVAIYTDSGGFIYSKMKAETHRIVADLVDAGVKPYDTFNRLYQTHDGREVMLFGRALSSLRFDHGGKIAWMLVTRRMYHDTGADPEASENYLLDYVRSIKAVELVVLLRQLPDGEVKVSFRAKSFFHVDGVARALGGGGHWFAAGAVVAGSLSGVHAKVKGLVERNWRKYSAGWKRGGAHPSL